MPELKLENSLVDGRFEVRERLNRGSYAEIYVARDRAAGGMDVVIKALNTRGSALRAPPLAIFWSGLRPL